MLSPAKNGSADVRLRSQDTNSSYPKTTFVGESVPRHEDNALLTGRGRFADDLGIKPGTLYAAVLRSSRAHALIKKIDSSQAEQLAGVRAILTSEDVKKWSKPFISGVKQPVELWALAMHKVRYVGEPLAVVIAESQYIAEDALELIDVDYESMGALTTIDEAIAEDALLIHDELGSNVAHDRSFTYGQPQQVFSQAEHTLDLTIHYPRNSCTPIECGVVVAEYCVEEDGYEVMSNFMGPFSMHAVMALALKVPGNRLRHRSPRDSGGSFGVKQSVFTSVVLMCLASRKVGGAPVKWVEDRFEHLSAATSATARKTTIRAAFDSSGRIAALDLDQLDDVGAFLRAPEPATFYRMHGCLTGPYQIQHLQVRNRVVVTNKTPTGLVRGFGGPQVYFALERMVQRIARFLNKDPIEIYQRNLIQFDQFPYRAAAGALLDSGNYSLAVEKVCLEGGREELLRKREQARAEGRLYGIGYAAIVEPSISNMGYITAALSAEQRAKAGPKNGALATATIDINLLGGVTVIVASTPAGQGHMTVCAQVVADVLGLKPSDIKVNVELDTEKDAWSVASGNYSSRFAGAVAGTVHLAAIKIRDKLKRIAAKQLSCEEDLLVFENAEIYNVNEPDARISFSRLASSSHWSPAELPQGEPLGMRVTEYWSPESLTAPTEDDRVNTSAAYGFVFDMCGVEIDPGTGAVRIDRYVTAHDAGKILHPGMADGQIRGAFAQGLGAALMEELRYGADGGFLSGSFADYLVPTSMEVPDPHIIHLETPSPFTPLGAKGLGEGNNMSTPVCIANAVADALSAHQEVIDIRLPLTPNKVMELIGIEDPEPLEPSLKVKKPLMKKGGGQALTATGSVHVLATREEVFNVLLDPKALAKVIPGCESLQAVGENSYETSVSISIGLIKATYQATVVLSEIDRPHSLCLSGEGKSSLGGAVGEGVLKLTESPEGGTVLHYEYSAEVNGKVAAVGGRMLEGAAKIVLGQLFEQLARQASGQEIQTKSTLIRKILKFLRIKK